MSWLFLAVRGDQNVHRVVFCDVTWPRVCFHAATERRDVREFARPMRYCAGHAALFDVGGLADHEASRGACRP